MVNKRFLDIVKLLLKQDDYITINDISNELGVSNKTIRNDLYQVETWLDEQGLKLIKKTGVGIAIEGDKTTKLHLCHLIQEKNNRMIDYSPDARKIYIGIKLVSNLNCRIYELADELYVSRATIHKDILALVPTFTSYKIKLHRKNNTGVSIEGSEKNKRQLLIDFLTQDNGYARFFEMVKNTDFECDGSFPFAAFDFNDDEIKEFLKVLENTNSSYLHSLLFASLVKVTLHLLVTFARIKDGYSISLSEGFVDELTHQPYYHDVWQLCEALENHYHVPFSDMEKHYLQVFFISLQNSSQIQDSDHEIARTITKQLIHEWGNLLPYNFSEDQELEKVVFNHLCPAITRFKHGIMIENPLMSDIKSIYPNTFDIVKQSIHIIEDYFKCKISDDEIGFFTLHLAAAMDRKKKPLNTILISHANVGATNLLAAKLRSQFLELNIFEIRSYITIHDSDYQDADLILTTTPLDFEPEVPVLVINTLLYECDIMRLKSIIRSFYKEKNDPTKKISTKQQ